MNMFYVSVPLEVINKIREQSKSAKAEVIGVLIGSIEGHALCIQDAITGDIKAERAAVSLLPKTIAQVSDKIIKGEIKGKIIGWYHSHLDMGVFLSPTDVKTQKNLQQFSDKVTALVIDPIRNEVGFFTLDKAGKIVHLPEDYVNIYAKGEHAIPPHFKEAPKELPSITPVYRVEGVSKRDLEAEKRYRAALRAAELRRRAALKRRKIFTAIAVIIVCAAVIGVSAALFISYKKPEVKIFKITVDNPVLRTDDYDVIQDSVNISVDVAHFDMNASRCFKLAYQKTNTTIWEYAVITVTGPVKNSAPFADKYIIVWEVNGVPNGIYKIRFDIKLYANKSISAYYEKLVAVDANTPVAQFVEPSMFSPPDVLRGNITLKADAKDYDGDNVSLIFLHSIDKKNWVKIGDGIYNHTSLLFEKEWDTRTVIDGIYYLRIKVTDTYGLKFEINYPYEIYIINHAVYKCI